MKKRFESIVNESISAICSFLSESSTNSKNEQSSVRKEPSDNEKSRFNQETNSNIGENIDNSVFYDLENSDNSETCLFDDSIGFSQELVLNKEELQQDMIVKTIDGKPWHPVSTVPVEKEHFEKLNKGVIYLQGGLERSRTEINNLKGRNERNIGTESHLDGGGGDQNTFVDEGGRKSTMIELDQSVGGLSIQTVSENCKSQDNRFSQSVIYQTTGKVEIAGGNMSFRGKIPVDVSFSETGRLLCALKEKDGLVRDLHIRLESIMLGKSKLGSSLDILRGDLVRSNENKEMITHVANEEIDSLKNTIESLRDQLEFERSKNNKIRAGLIDTRKKCVEMVVAVELLTNEL